MKPILKWPGGKTQLLAQIKAMMPANFGTYYEPFIGGGAVLLDLRPRRAVVNDINQELTNMYTQIKETPDRVLFELRALDHAHEASCDPKVFFYSVRTDFNRNLGVPLPEQAARLIYLNKHCFNGLYRVNREGLFNVSFNNRQAGNSFCEENLRQISAYLQGVEILTGDFVQALSNVDIGDFVFFDSPYVPVKTTSFSDYTKEGFGYEDHLRLAASFEELTKQGVYCMLTNHNTDLVRHLYQDYYIKVVPVARNINRKGGERKGEEVIITNYEPPCEAMIRWCEGL